MHASLRLRMRFEKWLELMFDNGAGGLVLSGVNADTLQLVWRQASTKMCTCS
jgi:hypothetical protein